MRTRKYWLFYTNYRLCLSCTSQIIINYNLAIKIGSINRYIEGNNGLFPLYIRCYENFLYPLQLMTCNTQQKTSTQFFRSFLLRVWKRFFNRILGKSRCFLSCFCECFCCFFSKTYTTNCFSLSYIELYLIEKSFQ